MEEEREEVGVSVLEGVVEELLPDRGVLLLLLVRVEEEVLLGVAEGEAPCESVAVGEVDTVPLGVAVPLEVGEAVPVPEGECVADTLGLCEELGVLEGEAPLVSEEVGETLTVDDPVSVEVVVGLGVGVTEEVGVGVGSADTDPVPEVLGLEDTEGVMEGDAPTVKLGVWEALSVLLPLTVDDGVATGVTVPDKVGVPVLDEVGVPVAERLAVVEGLPDTLALAPTVREAVGEVVRVVLLLKVEEGVREAVPVLLLVGVAVAVGEGVWVPVGLEDRELLPVFDAESPFEIEAVGDTVMVLLPLGVVEEVMEGELVLLDVGVPLEVGERVMGGVEEGEKEALPEALGEDPWVREGVGEELSVLLPLKVEEGVIEAVPVPLHVEVAVAVGEGVWVPVGLEDRELLPVFDAESPMGREAVGDTV